MENCIKVIWYKYFRIESNPNYLIRKFLYFAQSSNAIKRRLASIYQIQLLRRYNICIDPRAEIGVGLRLIHPSGLYITRARIGNNFTVYQNCTIGIKSEDKRDEAFVHIGNNVTMYSNSSILGNVEVSDDCVLGAFACLLTSTKSSGVFVGIPAEQIRERKRGKVERILTQKI